jgi:hypothetical protein
MLREIRALKVVQRKKLKNKGYDFHNTDLEYTKDIYYNVLGFYSLWMFISVQKLNTPQLNTVTC